MSETLELKVLRFASKPDFTIGAFSINGKFECFTLEDEYREHKVSAETRIPDGTYDVGLRTVGGFHNRYKGKFPAFHIGMLEVLKVPNFKYILIHIGNTDKDTAGCLLIGRTADARKGFVGNSTQAYTAFYERIFHYYNVGDTI